MILPFHRTIANNYSTRGPIELLAPAGNLEAGYAALHYGADAVYLGLENFSARASAVNFSIEELADITGYAHSLPKRRKIYAAINTLVLQNEMDELIDLLAVIADIGIDAVIVQDLGVLNILHRNFPQIKIHASTQMATHNPYGVEAAQKLGIARVTLARELTLAEIADIAAQAGIETEVFIHGALCYSYSGLCLFSSHLHGRSGNRGKCAYPCREWFKPEVIYDGKLHCHSERSEESLQQSLAWRRSVRCAQDDKALTPATQKGGFIFSMKDLALPDHVSELRRVGVTALKIEGRMKSPLYVAAAVNYYRHMIDGRMSPDKEREMASDVQTVFSRPWTDLYLRARGNRGVTDTETQGHRGSPAGKAEEIAKNPGGHCLRFKTALPLELHDGLQIDIAGLPRPFGFAVKNINIIGGCVPDKKRVFTAPAGARVEIQLPRGHPVIPLGAVIYSSSSQKVKQQYDFFRPKPGQFRFRQTADFDIHVEVNGLDVTASVNVEPGVKGEKEGKRHVEAKKHYEGLFQQAKNIGQVDSAITTAFGKLGGTIHLKPGKLSVNNPHNLFVPISLLNSIRRDISAALEQEIAELPRKYAAIIKSDSFPELTGVEHDNIAPNPGKTHKQACANNHNFKWSLKTDQPHLLSAFNSDDWRDIDEVIIECVRDVSPEFIGQLDLLAGKVEKSRLRLALPVIMRHWETESFAKTVPDLIAKGWRKWQISNLGGWAFLHKMTKAETALDISSDRPVYAMNRAAVLQLKAMGISRFTLSPEDGFENMRIFLNEYSANAVVIIYQDTPLMISETCVFAPGKCSYPDICKFRELFFSAPRGEEIRVISRNCRSIVLNSRPFCLAAHLKELALAGAINLRADFMHRGYSDKEALDIWRRLRSGALAPLGHNANFNRGID